MDPHDKLWQKAASIADNIEFSINDEIDEETGDSFFIVSREDYGVISRGLTKEGAIKSAKTQLISHILSDIDLMLMAEYEAFENIMNS